MLGVNCNELGQVIIQLRSHSSQKCVRVEPPSPELNKGTNAHTSHTANSSDIPLSGVGVGVRLDLYAWALIIGTKEEEQQYLLSRSGADKGERRGSEPPHNPRGGVIAALLQGVCEPLAPWRRFCKASASF